ncbi:hypothetical protein BC940DRAFT_323084 [Gongronella butleri]|nr:hypothetical protein BC940DRAFT_323084 [Gongronella butleri]
MDKEQENEHKKPLPQLERHDSLQRSHDDDLDTSTEAAAVPKRAQQRRRRNLSLNGEIDVEPASGAGGGGASGSGQQGKWLFPSHKNDQRRESWIDRLNETAIKAIRRTSGIVTATDEQHFVDKMAAMLNEYDDGKGAGAPAHGETWTDKVLDFLFPSLHAGESTTEKSNGTALEGEAAFSAPSDLSYDDVQSQVTKDDQVQWRDDARRAATLKNRPETKYNLAESARGLPDAPDDAHNRIRGGRRNRAGAP